nr:MAG TPA: hypothetical protein [Bacteriophage sp.]
MLCDADGWQISGCIALRVLDSYLVFSSFLRLA